MSDKPHIFPQGSNKWKTRPRPLGPAHAYSLSRILSTSIILSQTLTTELVKVPLSPLCTCFALHSPLFQILLRHPAEDSARSRITVIVIWTAITPPVSGDWIAFLLFYSAANHLGTSSSTSRLHYSFGPLPPTTAFLLRESLTGFARDD